MRTEKQSHFVDLKMWVCGAVCLITIDPLYSKLLCKLGQDFLVIQYQGWSTPNPLKYRGRKHPIKSKVKFRFVSPHSSLSKRSFCEQPLNFSRLTYKNIIIFFFSFFSRILFHADRFYMTHTACQGYWPTAKYFFFVFFF